MSMTNKNIAIALILVVSVMTFGYEARASYRSTAFCKNVGEYGDPIYKRNVLKRRVLTMSNGNPQYVFTHEGAIPGSQYLCSVEVSGDKVVRTEALHVWTL